MVKKRCSRCFSSNVKKNGLYGNGKQRWWCGSCKRSFSGRNTKCKQSREHVWFKRWIVEGYSVRQLTQQSEHSRNKLYRVINHWLSKIPPEYELTLEKHQYLIFDGTFLHRPVTQFWRSWAPQPPEICASS